MEIWAAMGIPPSRSGEGETVVDAAAACEELMLEEIGMVVSDVVEVEEDAVVIMVGVVCAIVELIKAVVVVGVVGRGTLLIKVLPVVLGFTQ